MLGKHSLAFLPGLLWLPSLISKTAAFDSSGLSKYTELFDPPRYGSHAGSYFNGTLNFSFDIEPKYDSVNRSYPGEVCREKPTLEIEYNAILSILPPHEPELSGENPIVIGLTGWEKMRTLQEEFNATNSDIHEFRIFTDASYVEESVAWNVDVSISEDEEYYLFNAEVNMDENASGLPSLIFNFTEQCSDPSQKSDEDDEEVLNFIGDIINTKKITEMEGRFNDEKAAFNLTGRYSMSGENSILFGRYNVTFDGVLNSASAKLLMDGDKPRWGSADPPSNASSGEGEGDEDGGNTVGVNMLLTFGMVFFMIGFLM